MVLCSAICPILTLPSAVPNTTCEWWAHSRERGRGNEGGARLTRFVPRSGGGAATRRRSRGCSAGTCAKCSFGRPTRGRAARGGAHVRQQAVHPAGSWTPQPRAAPAPLAGAPCRRRPCCRSGRWPASWRWGRRPWRRRGRSSGPASRRGPRHGSGAAAAPLGQGASSGIRAPSARARTLFAGLVRNLSFFSPASLNRWTTLSVVTAASRALFGEQHMAVTLHIFRRAGISGCSCRSFMAATGAARRRK